MTSSFKAFRIHSEGGRIAARFEPVTLDELAPGEVVIRVSHSDINYKDALAATGAGKILRRYPLVGGIDLAGVVETSSDARYRPGAAGLVTGCRPLENARFAGAIDNLGGELLAWLTRSVDFWGNIASIGMAGSAELKTTVMPFILRGVNLLGINSSATRREWRLAVWKRIATDLRPRHVRRISAACPLPLLVDADTGFGSAFNIARTCAELMRAGAAGMHLEDQVSAKRCGHRPGKALVSAAEMVDRLKAAVDARSDGEF